MSDDGSSDNDSHNTKRMTATNTYNEEETEDCMKMAAADDTDTTKTEVAPKTTTTVLLSSTDKSAIKAERYENANARNNSHERQEILRTIPSAFAIGDNITKTNVTPQTTTTVLLSSTDKSAIKAEGGENTNASNAGPSVMDAANDSNDHREELLRTTPGAFAIHNPLSIEAALPLSSHARQLSELRPTLQSVSSQCYSVSITHQNEDVSGMLNSASSISHSEEKDHPMKTRVSNLGDQGSETHCFPAVFVGHDDDVYEGKVIIEDNTSQKQDTNMNEDESQKTKRRPRCILVTFMALFLVVAIAFGVVIISKNLQPRQSGNLRDSNDDDFNIKSGSSSNKTKTNDITPSGTLSPSAPATNNIFTSTQQQHHLQKQQIKEYLVSIIGPISGAAGADVFERSNEDTSMDRIMALEWLVNDVFTKSNDVAETSDWKLLQRYILVLLYFATNGDDWDLRSNFLSEDDECLWNETPRPSWVKTSTSTTILDLVPNITGVTCNEDGKVKDLTMHWNDLAGTLPHELSYLKNSLEEIDFGVGSISGTIPSSWGQLTNLKGLILNDNCLSGTIPETFMAPSSISSDQMRPLRSLERLNLINNPNLSGSLNGFCKTTTGSSEYREGIDAVAGDCGMNTSADNIDSESAGVECDCCICCNHDNYQCHDPRSGNSWKSYDLDVITSWQSTKSFGAKRCRTHENKRWISEECPCYIERANDTGNDNLFANDTTSSQRNVCTTDCDQEGAEWTYVDFFWW